MLALLGDKFYSFSHMRMPQIFHPLFPVFALSLIGQAFFSPQVEAVDDAYGPILLRDIVTGMTQPFSPDSSAEAGSSGPPSGGALAKPVFVTSPPDDARHLFILEQSGKIRIFDQKQKTLMGAPFLVISPIKAGGEQGLLGLAFHPNFSETRYFYVNFTATNGDTIIRRYRMQSGTAPYEVEEGSGLDLLKIAQPYSNHNGGWIGFGPQDGYLYIGMGDGGAGNDPPNNGQNKDVLLGKMLRIDVNGDDFPDDSTRNYAIPASNPFVGKSGRDEIWAYGLRNPWRNSFDRETGDLWMGDVGQNAREEIDFQPASSSGGENYGWRLREGFIATPENGVGGNKPSGAVDPVYDYGFDGGQSITGGYVYRGSAMPQLKGHYFFAEYVNEFVKSFRYEGSSVGESDLVIWISSVSRPSSFGEDANGELYIVTHNGGVYQMTQSAWNLWRNRHFNDAEIHDPAISGPEASPQGDGIPNLLKFALGLDPQKTAAKLPVDLASETMEGQRYLVLSVDRSPTADGIDMVVEAANRLSSESSWESEGLVIIQDDADRLLVRDSVSVDEANQRFLRLRVSQEQE